MATTYKVLGQSNPAAATATTLYTVPAATSTVVSTINICNQSVSADSLPLASSTTGSPTVTSASGYRYYTFTTSGSITF
jgi:membrane-bound inhibitor of C-type lysozyme